MKKLWILLLVLCIVPFAFARAQEDTFEPSSRPLIDGIDISQFNTVTSFDDIRDAGIGMVYIRSSLGFSHVDTRLERHADGAQEAGLPFGFYHFCTASTADEAVRQAEFCYETTRPYTPQLRYVLELDPSRPLDRDAFNEVAVAFLERIADLTDTTPAIYSDASTARDRYDDRVAAYPLWVADWGVAAPEPVIHWRVWVGWQYGGSDRIPGTEGRIDRDYFTREMRIDATPPPTPTPTPPPTPTPTPDCGHAYVVQPGDTLTAIARRFDTTVESLMEINELPNTTIYRGQILRFERDAQ